MCTSGWVPTANGAILFKNRDRPDTVVPSKIHRENGVIFLADEKYGGCWFGWNGAIAISDTTGPYTERAKGQAEEKEIFAIMRDVLESANSIEEGVGMYKELFVSRNVGMSFNILLSDGKQAAVLELAGKDASETRTTSPVYLANTFRSLKRCVPDRSPSVAWSLARIEVLEQARPSTAESVLELLRMHNGPNSICRHFPLNPSKTISSAVLEWRGDKLFLHHILDGPPCKKPYRTLELIAGFVR